MNKYLWLISFLLLLLTAGTVSAEELSAEPLPNEAGQTALFLGEIDALPEADQSEPPAYPVGSAKSFNVLDQSDGPTYRTVEAAVVYSGENAVFWLDNAWTAGVPEDAAAEFARYDTEVLPMLRRVFGAEKSAGIDNDRRVHILLTEAIGADLAGYYSSEDGEDPRVNPNSNGMDMVLINASGMKDPEGMMDTLAHETEHLLQHEYDTNEDDFIDEGLAQMAAYLARGKISDAFVKDYLNDLGRSLIYWPAEGNKRAYYGSSFLFQMYLYERFGEDILSAEMQSPENGLNGVDAALKAVGADVSADEVYREWMAAMLAELLQSPAKFRGYRRYVFPQEGIYRDLRELQCGTDETHELPQYGFHAYSVDCGAPFEITVTGAADTETADLSASDGNYALLSSAVNKSLAVLRHDFDLSGVSGEAVFSFDLAYDIEDGYDFLYILLKDADGKTVRACPAFAVNDGSCGITGKSDGTVRAQIDLSAYAGSTVSVVFAYVTDSASLESGVMIDNAALPAIEYYEDFEQGAEGWYGSGWRRAEGTVPQQWDLVVIPDSGEPSVYSFEGGEAFTVECPDTKCVFALSPVSTESRARAQYSVATQLLLEKDGGGFFSNLFDNSAQIQQIKDTICDVAQECVE